MSFIDTHVHFYDPRRPEGLTWPPNATVPALPADLSAELGDDAPEQVIAVETSQRAIDDEWLLELATRHGIIGGVILNLQIESDDFDTHLARNISHPTFKGVRLRPISRIDLTSPQLIDKIRQLPGHANVVEAGCPNSNLLRQFIKLAAQAPEQQFILDHFGHPNITAGGVDSIWSRNINQAAKLRNIAVKITAMAQFSNNNVKPNAHYAPTLDALQDAFGEDRIIIGSNWPLVKRSGGYQANIQIVTQHFRQHPNLLSKLIHQNARRLYQLPP